MININYYTNFQSMMKQLEGPLEKKAGKVISLSLRSACCFCCIMLPCPCYNLVGWAVWLGLVLFVCHCCLMCLVASLTSLLSAL